uniref:Immunoglobulin domain-containing protein n=1 Tax=Terrapene triunguis TaxID=2587831 RepID=A0A674J118_9SAUR
MSSATPENTCLLCADPNLPRPSISLSPTWVTPLGADVTIRCQGQRRDVRFFLHKAGDLNPQRQMDPAGDGAEFRIPTVGWQHRGSYSCSYRQGAVSPLFNSCLLLKAGREYPKPTILVSPSRVVALVGSVTIRCEGRYRSMKFFLRKAGHPNPQVRPVPDGTVAEFPIPSVSREDGGNYTCDYHSITDLNRWSFPSDPIEIIVAGEGPEPGSALIPGSSRGDTWLGTESLWGSPARGEKQPLEIWGTGRGDPCPQGELQSGGGLSQTTHLLRGDRQS